jgi:hypothetical protein
MLAISQLSLPKICQQVTRRPTLPSSAYPVPENTAVAVPYRTRALGLRRTQTQAPLNNTDVQTVIDNLVIGQSTYYKLLWEKLPGAPTRRSPGPRSSRSRAEIYSQTAREEFRLGPASSVQKALSIPRLSGRSRPLSWELLFPRPIAPVLD